MAVMALVAITACSSHGLLTENDYEVRHVSIVSDDHSVNTQTLKNYVHQRPGLMNGKRQHVAYDTLQTQLSCRDLEQALRNEGYLHASVDAECSKGAPGADGKPGKCSVRYTLHPHERYSLRKIRFDIADHRRDVPSGSSRLVGRR